MMRGAELLVRALRARGVRQVFGLPATANVRLVSALAESGIDFAVPMHELSAAFSALGYGLSTGTAGVLITSGGPGFCYSVAALAEALHDSVPLVHIVPVFSRTEGRDFQLQDIDHQSVAASVAKSVRCVDSVDDLAASVHWAFERACAGEPGPVVLLVSENLLASKVSGTESVFTPDHDEERGSSVDIRPLLPMLRGRKVLIYCGRGAFGAEDSVRALMERYGWALATTTSGRGLVAEDDSQVLRIDGCSIDCVNEVFDSFDTVLAMGMKFSHNSAFGFNLTIDEEKLVHIDAEANVLGGAYAAAASVCSSVEDFCAALAELPSLCHQPAMPIDLEKLRDRLQNSRPDEGYEPTFVAESQLSSARFFGILQSSLPASTIFVSDSGLHQVLLRRHILVRFPRQLLVPTNFQSMGFGLPVANAAALVDRARPVVLILGDGGFAMSASDLRFAVSRELNLIVVVFDDGAYGLIRQQQHNYGLAVFGTGISGSGVRKVSESFGAMYCNAATGLEESIAKCLSYKGPAVLHVELRDSDKFTKKVRRGQVKRALKRMVGR